MADSSSLHPWAPPIDPDGRRFSHGVPKPSDRSSSASSTPVATPKLPRTFEEAASCRVRVAQTTELGSRCCQRPLKSKPLQFEGKGELTEEAFLRSFWQEGVAFGCFKGNLQEEFNQDHLCVLRGEDFLLLCVLDGHGPVGHLMSDFCRRTLPKLFLMNPQRVSNPSRALQDAYIQCQALLLASSETTTGDSGTTCTIAYAHDGSDLLFVSHVGDSRAVLGVANGSENLTEDHSPDLQEEQDRIQASDGQVIFEHGRHRVFTRVGHGGLHLSRSLGDSLLRDAGVSEIPEVRVLRLQETHEFVLLCSDGVWQVLSREQACGVVREEGRDKPEVAVRRLSQLSYAAWMAKHPDTELSDDISIVLAWL